MIVLSDTAFHAAEGDPANLKLCPRGAWEDRMLVETVLSMLTVVCHLKKVMHRGWAYFHARLAFTMAAFNVLVQWHRFEPNASGFVPLSIAEFNQNTIIVAGLSKTNTIGYYGHEKSRRLPALPYERKMTRKSSNTATTRCPGTCTGAISAVEQERARERSTPCMDAVTSFSCMVPKMGLGRVRRRVCERYPGSGSVAYHFSLATFDDGSVWQSDSAPH
jgi:hypothetical protein